jgi:hypothetical protein
MFRRFDRIVQNKARATRKTALSGKIGNSIESGLKSLDFTFIGALFAGFRMERILIKKDWDFTENLDKTVEFGTVNVKIRLEALDRLDG